MKGVLALSLAIAAGPAIAGGQHPGGQNHTLVVYEQERTIDLASDLVPWCKSEAESRYIARNITPYQWAASYHDRSSVLYVEGRLRVHGDDVTVRCRIARGAREKYAVIEIDDDTL